MHNASTLELCKEKDITRKICATMATMSRLSCSARWTAPVHGVIEGDDAIHGTAEINR
jgi:hypothetical protein